MRVVWTAVLLTALAIASAAHADDSAEQSMLQCPGLAEWQAATEERIQQLHLHRDAPTMPALHRELLAMMARDQAVRESTMRGDGKRQTPAEIRAMHGVDAANLRRFKQIFRRLGMPGVSQVGRDGAEAAFLIVQHAYGDPIQTAALRAMERMVASYEVAPSAYALLLDRVLMSRGEPQRYGSQFQRLPDGKALVLYTVEAPAELDARREAMFLPPIAIYACILQKNSGLPTNLSALDAGLATSPSAPSVPAR